MKSKKEIAQDYINFLENSNTEQIVALFSENGQVVSPLYGTKSAKEFYLELNNDTNNSELSVLGIFEEKDSNQLALYFSFKWTLKNNEVVVFDVVDIIKFDEQHKITQLKIIYDTVLARKLVTDLKNE